MRQNSIRSTTTVVGQSALTGARTWNHFGRRWFYFCAARDDIYGNIKTTDMRPYIVLHCQGQF